MHLVAFLCAILQKLEGLVPNMLLFAFRLRFSLIKMNRKERSLGMGSQVSCSVLLQFLFYALYREKHTVKKSAGPRLNK